MKVEIWSDVMCPFCYIGKRHFEKALDGFPDRDSIVIEWKSFQLNPGMKTEPGKNINQYLAEHKGWSLQQAEQANQYVTDMAARSGLEYHMDLAVVANSFDAHRLIQLAKTTGRDGEMEERLFHAYFSQGKNIADHEVLMRLAGEAGLEADRVKQVLESGEFSDAVEQDIYEARQIGVNGVPYFVLNDQYSVSGAQPAETFAGALRAAWKGWQEQHPSAGNPFPDGENTCTVDGNC